ncbi:hypothetical protein P4H71_02115 [Paenibacillus kribbensis]|uniref:hypothetical protein n=1 Tax=Paenibacillus kribbensis TaxID=172713 RepID=UPI002DBA26BD|nr:hypothetical protein [Paenibacillus kribbensis]MEC0233152.1 hypothetical protein [Paenibacillus kribbensis]
MGTKQLVIIHGRDKKPKCDEMLRLIKMALIAGLRRVNEEAAQRLEQEHISLTFSYYGDINNRLLLESRPRYGQLFEKEEDGNFYVPDHFYDESMQQLINRPTDQMTPEEYELLIANEPIIHFYDDAAKKLSPYLSLFGMSTRAIKKLLPDLGAYLTSRVVGSQIRERLQAPLTKALSSGDDVMLLSHSMGCMVAYDVLWKFSRMSEYKHLWEYKVNEWITLGNPLGEPAVKRSLYDSNEPDDGMYPANIRHWTNINAVDDYIAHDAAIEDDFYLMLSRNLIESINDQPLIYTFWKDSHTGRTNPHNFFAYLNHPKVAEQVANWILRS